MDYKHILKHWNIIKPTNIKKMKSYNKKRCLIVTYKANKYVLKEKNNIKRINCEYYLLSKLINHNIPVTIPTKTINNGIYITYRNKLYCLYGYLAGKVYKNHYNRGANKRAKNYGMAIAQLHKGLKQIKRRNIFAKMDLLNDINGWISDTISKENKLLNIKFINSIIKEINLSFKKSYKNLPKQLIHRDIHPSNMIFLNNKLKGFIDFEIATHGIRIFDPCYCATSILIGRFRDKKARLKWFSLLKSIFKGYNSINRLKKTEINAIFYVLLSIQLLFMAYMVKINGIKTAKFNQSALKWIYDNKNTINKELQTS